MVDFDKIKCIIVDFDKTLYSEADLSNVNKEYSKFFVEHNLLDSIKNYKNILKENPGFHMAQCIFKIARENNIPDKVIREWFDNNIYDVTCPEMRIVNAQLLKELCNKFPVYILSDSCQGHLNYYLKLFNYKKSWFKGIIPNKFIDEKMTKTPHMIEIVKKHNLSSDEVLMIGDSIKSDIQAADNAGLQWEHVGSVDDVENIIRELIK